MRCLISIPTSTRWHTYRGRSGKRYEWESYRTMCEFETTVYRVAMPRKQNTLSPYVLVDAWIPEERRGGIPILDSNWVGPGVLRTPALIKKNGRTLAPFLASGLNEMDVREAA